MQVPTIAIMGSGGGFRALTAFAGALTALWDAQVVDMATYIGGLSGSAWYVCFSVVKECIFIIRPLRVHCSNLPLS